MGIGAHLDQTCTLINIVDGPADEYNNPTRVAVPTPSPCHFQPGASTETVVGEDRSVANGLLFLPAGAAVDSRTRVDLGDGPAWDVNGTPAAYAARRGSHIEARLVRVEGG